MIRPHVGCVRQCLYIQRDGSFDGDGRYELVGISWFGVLLPRMSVPYGASGHNPDDGFAFVGLSAGTCAHLPGRRHEATATAASLHRGGDHAAHSGPGTSALSCCAGSPACSAVLMPSAGVVEDGSGINEAGRRSRRHRRSAIRCRASVAPIRNGAPSSRHRRRQCRSRPQPTQN